MTNATTIHPQHDPSLCPAWCDGSDHLQHTLTVDGFHHDGPLTTIWLTSSSARDDDMLAVRVSAHVLPGETTPSPSSRCRTFRAPSSSSTRPRPDWRRPSSRPPTSRRTPRGGHWHDPKT